MVEDIEQSLIANEAATQDNGYEVFVANISWNPKAFRQVKKEGELPTQLSMTIPENVLKQAQKPSNVFNDIIESYVYNTLSKKFLHEIYKCQIWLPLEDK